jgi:hypothetical protein
LAGSQNCGKWLLHSSCLSISLHGTTRLLLDGFSWNFMCIFGCREISSFIKIGQVWLIFCMEINVHFFLSYLAQFFEWEMCNTKDVEKIRTHMLCSITSPPPFKNRTVHEVMWKNIVQPDKPQLIIIRRIRISCRITKVQLHTQNMWYLFIFQRNNSPTKAPQCYIACLAIKKCTNGI